MSFTPREIISSPVEGTAEQIDSTNEWVDKIELPDDFGDWQDSIELLDDSSSWQDSVELPEDMSNISSTPMEEKKTDLSRFEEAKQVREIVSFLNNLPEVKRENWINLSLDERVKVFQEIETQLAKIACRPALAIEIAPMNKNDLGYMNWGAQKIVINSDLLNSNRTEDFQKAIKTLLHESRHAFQYSNIILERTEPNNEKYQAWVLNIATGYCVAKLFGMKNYYLQPLEVDARVFSEAIVSRMKN